MKLVQTLCQIDRSSYFNKASGNISYLFLIHQKDRETHRFLMQLRSRNNPLRNCKKQRVNCCRMILIQSNREFESDSRFLLIRDQELSSPHSESEIRNQLLHHQRTVLVSVIFYYGNKDACKPTLVSIVSEYRYLQNTELQQSQENVVTQCAALMIVYKRCKPLNCR